MFMLFFVTKATTQFFPIRYWYTLEPAYPYCINKFKLLYIIYFGNHAKPLVPKLPLTIQAVVNYSFNGIVSLRL